MVKSIILLIVAAAFVAVLAPAANAQITASKAFATAPQTVFPLLDANTRLDMIDYYNSHLATSSQNKLQGKSRITNLSDKSMKIEMSPASSHELIILPGDGKDNIIALITTLATPTPDSNIAFYTSDWKPLAAGKYFSKPVLADWLTESGKSNRQQVEMILPFLLVEYQWLPETSSLLLKNNMRQFLSNDVYEEIADDLRPSLQYKWEGGKMKKSNE